MNGGFVGDNIVPKEDRLKKFDGKQTIRTFNFDIDVESTDKVLKSSTEKIEKIILVGKNVCHSKKILGMKFGILKNIIIYFQNMLEDINASMMC